MHLTIPNFNNKLASDVFLHIYKSLGQYTGEHFLTADIKINEIPDTYQVHDIGVSTIAELPSWMFFTSHNCTAKEYMQSVKATPDTKIYFMIFKKIIN